MNLQETRLSNLNLLVRYLNEWDSSYLESFSTPTPVLRLFKYDRVPRLVDQHLNAITAVGTTAAKNCLDLFSRRALENTSAIYPFSSKAKEIQYKPANQELSKHEANKRLRSIHNQVSVTFRDENISSNKRPNVKWTSFT